MWKRRRSFAPKTRRGARSDWLVLLGFILLLSSLAPVLGQPPPSPEQVPDEAVQQEIDEALDEISEEIEESLRLSEEAVEEISSERERVREIRERVRRRLREAPSRSDSKVAFGSSIHIESDEVGQDLVAIGGSIRVDGDIYGDAIAVGGSIRVDGSVTGDVVAVGGGVKLGAEAEVLGEVTSVGGRVDLAEGARVHGSVNEVSIGKSIFPLNFGDEDLGIGVDDGEHHWSMSPFGFSRWVGLGWSLSGLVLLILLTSLVQLIGAGTVERVRLKAVASPWASGLVGLAIQVLFVPTLVVVCLILTISIVGIPLLFLLPFVVLAFLIAFLVGYTGSAMAVGRWAEARFNWGSSGSFLVLLSGVLLIRVLSFVGKIFESLSGFLWIFALMFGIVGFLVRYAAWTVGLGAVFLSSLRGGNALSVPQIEAPEPLLPPLPEEPAPDSGIGDAELNSERDEAARKNDEEGA